MGWTRIVFYLLIALLLNGVLIFLIIQRRELSPLDQFVFLYLLASLACDALRGLVAVAMLLVRGAPRLAQINEAEWPPLTVVIPCHNEAEVIAATIHSLQAVDYPDLRLIVVDDGSSDNTPAIVTACQPRPLLLRQRAAGKAAALNRGIAQVRTPLTLLVDADCLFPRQGLRDAVRHLFGEEEDALGGHLSVLNHDNGITRLQGLEYGEIALRHFLWRFALNLSHTQDVIPGALGLYRTSALRAAGPLSSAHLAEDVALTARLVEQGRRLAFSPYLQAATVVPDALTTLRIQRRRWVRGYTQVAFQQLGRLGRIPNRARLAALAMVVKTVRWPLDFALALVYGLHAWSQGEPAVLLLSVLAMPFPLSLSGLSCYLRGDPRMLLVFTYGYGMLLLGWRLWDQLTLLITPNPRWEPYRRRQAGGPGPRQGDRVHAKPS